jgi:hypothetical protein
VRLKVLTVKNKLVTKDHKKPRTWTDYLDKRPKRKKMDMTFGTWNVRSMYRASSFRALKEDISEYKLDLVGVQEVRWDGSGTAPAGEYTVTCREVRATKMTGSSSDDWIY